MANEPEVTDNTEEETGREAFEERYCAVQQVGAMLAANNVSTVLICNVPRCSWLRMLRFTNETVRKAATSGRNPALIDYFL